MTLCISSCSIVLFNMEMSLLNDTSVVHLQSFRLLLAQQACLRVAVRVSACLSALPADISCCHAVIVWACNRERKHSNGQQGRAGACDSCFFWGFFCLANQTRLHMRCDARATGFRVLYQRVFVCPAAASHPPCKECRALLSLL